MTKLIGYARASKPLQSTDRQEADIVAAGVRRDDLYIDEDVSGARASRSQFDTAKSALALGDTFVVTTVDRLGRPIAASLAISAGANVKAVQRMFGDASAAMTLDTYADLFEDDLDDASERMDRIRAETLVGFRRGLWGFARLE